MKFRRIAAALLTLALGFCLCQPMAFAAQTAELPGLSVSIQSTGETPLPKETLTVELEAVGSAPMPQITTLEITDGETAKFGPITYTTPGVYQYTITQRAGSNARGEYDNTVYHVVVTASWDNKNGKDVFGVQVAVHTSADLKDDKTESVVFTNNYKGTTPTPDPDPTPTPVPTPVDPDDPYDPVTPPTPDTPVNPDPADARPDTPDTTSPDVPKPSDTPSWVADARPEGPKLIQTGQLNWPVPVLTAGGLVLVAVGGYLLHRSKKRDENA